MITPNHSTKKLQQDFVVEQFGSFGFIPNMEGYINTKSKIGLLCKNGHLFFSSYNYVQSGKGCPKCKALKLSERQRGYGNSMFGKRGKDSPRWNGGKEKKRIPLDAWRTEVFMRDDFRCVRCGSKKGGTLQSHHLFPYMEFQNVKDDIRNGVTLCVDCHKEFHKSYGYNNTDAYDFIDYVDKEKWQLIIMAVKAKYPKEQ